MRAVFRKDEQELNAKLLVKLTARGLGMSAKAFRELPQIMEQPTENDKLKAAVDFVVNNVMFPPELPAFDPSICQSPMTDKGVLELYEEFDDRSNQVLYAGGANGTIWMKVDKDCPMGVLEEPYAMIGRTEDGGVVVKQEYVKFLRQFLPEEQG